ncbi:outer membrane protein assembly factor BamE [Undibacterium crateris]|uniref:outer membrane protein assembly factor BamE n=1 Tax=Undibacterium crateris TaxID=2528175 RepID=UPI001389EBB2|nr:outer membrane protein assembly factor BamE [Undibacterium crateris]NDI86112.1 outer membrane protein assembly factor BamE [Undibacterium crateris]
MRMLFSESIPVHAGRFAAILLLTALSACASKTPLLADDASKADPAATATSGTQVYAPTGAKKFLGYISPYRVTVQQGNFVSQEMMSQIKEGMNREQVRTVLGTALLTDMFHEDRWDYPFNLTKPNGERVVSRVTIHFKNNLVSKFEGGNLPNEKEYLARITESALTGNRVESVTDLDGTPKKKDKK